MRNITGWTATLAAAVTLAVISTFADLVWALWIPRHRTVYGLVHGALLFMLVGVVLGVLAARRRDAVDPGGIIVRAAGGELVAGLAAAATFYVLAGFIGWAAMFVAWMWVWMLTAFINRWVRASAEGMGMTLGRGVAAAALSGIAFWAISGIWLDGSTADPDYPVNLVSWFIAFAPGFACLLLEPGGESDAQQTAN